MRRREFIIGLGGAVAAWPLASRAQQSERVRRIGVLRPVAEDDPEMQIRMAAFQQALERLGWAEGRNLTFVSRAAAADPDQMLRLAQELIALSPDLILTSTNLATSSVGRLTRTIPIVFTGAGDPLGTGLVSSMARPGGNMTGFTTYEFAISGKWLELLREAVSSLTDVMVLYTPGGAGPEGMIRTIESVAPSLGIRTTLIPARDGGEIEQAIAAAAGGQSRGLVVLPGPSTQFHRAAIIAAAVNHRVPAIHAARYQVREGGLMSYAGDIIEQYRQAASYVDRILGGEKPGDLPVQASTRYELVINLRTARAIGLEVPPSLLARADEVIE